MSTTEYPVEVDTRTEQDETAAPDQASVLGRRYYYVEDCDS